ncbi:MAG: MurR/RpiR family transcriptional regulator [Lachnospiraceae bacterium]|jgi:DNA-binding MurR/RpiR family transcriptional regulator|nr:MurR/RpiR family transcriptional regulator [Lachnospiraceae bacterium]
MKENKTTNEFFLRVEAHMEKLSKKEKLTAQCMLDNQEKLIYSSITELARLAGSSEATVTRLCGKLGYPSFQALKVDVARELVTPTQLIHEQLTDESDIETIINSVFSSAVGALKQTQMALNKEDIEKCIQAILKCRRLIIVGNGNSAAIALDAGHKFLRIGMDVHAYTDDHMQMIAIASMGKEDVLLVCSHSGSSKDAKEAAELAKKNGAFIITVTSVGNSPVAKLANIALHTKSSEILYRINAIASRMAELTIIDTLYTGVALRSGQVAIDNFKHLEEALVVKKY